MDCVVQLLRYNGPTDQGQSPLQSWEGLAVERVVFFMGVGSGNKIFLRYLFFHLSEDCNCLLENWWPTTQWFHLWRACWLANPINVDNCCILRAMTSRVLVIFQQPGKLDASGSKVEGDQDITGRRASKVGRDLSPWLFHLCYRLCQGERRYGKCKSDLSYLERLAVLDLEVDPLNGVVSSLI